MLCLCMLCIPKFVQYDNSTSTSRMHSTCAPSIDICHMLHAAVCYMLLLLLLARDTSPCSSSRARQLCTTTAGCSFAIADCKPPLPTDMKEGRTVPVAVLFSVLVLVLVSIASNAAAARVCASDSVATHPTSAGLALVHRCWW